MNTIRLPVLLALLSLAAPVLAKPPAKAAASKRHTFKLQNEPLAAPNPGPTALIHLGKGFKKDGPLNLVVHFHGIWNCISVDAEAKNASCSGKPGTQHNMIGQVDASGVNAVFVGLEVAYASNNTNSGKLANDGFFSSMIDELLPLIGKLAGRSYSKDDLGKVILTSHSGGYNVLADVLAHGSVPIAGVLLFDSLYPNKNKKGPKDDQCFGKYMTWVQANTDGKLMVVYTNQGGTKVNSQQLAKDVAAAVGKDKVYDERKAKDAAAMKNAGLDKPFVFVNSAFAHDDSVRNWYAAFLKHAGL